MSLIHDIIKIKYTRLGYLPNYPYHLISDEEMFDAFIDLSYTGEDSTSGSDSDDGSSDYSDSSVERFFENTYPNPFLARDIVVDSSGDQTSLRAVYRKLKLYIVDTINEYLAHVGTAEEDKYSIPDWIYTYMLGEVIFNNSEYRDIYDLLVLLDCVNIDNTMTPEEDKDPDGRNNACRRCYEVSTKYISTLTTNIRPPTVFGEPHVIKQLRTSSTEI